MTLPLIIGMNNPLSRNPKHALWPDPPGCAGWRLGQLLREDRLLHRDLVTEDDYLGAFDRVNLVVGADWSASRGRSAAEEIRPELVGRRVVLLGASVRGAFGLAGPPVGRVDARWVGGDRTAGRIEFYLIPHPSGRNPWYNDTANRRAAGEVLGWLYEEGRR